MTDEISLQLAVVILLIITITFGNMSLVVSICTTKEVHDAAASYIVLSLAVADLLVGMWLLPFSIPALINQDWTLGSTMCSVNGFTNHVLSTASILGLFLISIDRYVSIFYPLNYHDYMTSKRAVALVICIWSYAILTAIMPLLGWSQYVFIRGIWLCVTNFKHSYTFSYFIILSVYGIPLSTMAFIYFKIFKVAFHHAKAIEQQIVVCATVGQADEDVVKPTLNKWFTSPVETEPVELQIKVDRTELNSQKTRANDTEDMIASIGSNQDDNGMKSKRRYVSKDKKRKFMRLKKEVRTALILFVIVVIFVASWTPFAILNLWALHTGKVTSAVSESIVSRLAYANSAINPPLYCLMSKVIRKSMRNLWYQLVKVVGFSRCLKPIERPSAQE